MTPYDAWIAAKKATDDAAAKLAAQGDTAALVHAAQVAEAKAFIVYAKNHLRDLNVVIGGTGTLGGLNAVFDDDQGGKLIDGNPVAGPTPVSLFALASQKKA
jgi:hypothetical protein